MAKSGRREKIAKARSERKAAKRVAMARGGMTSEYAKKKREQANGNFRPGSPFERGDA